MSIQALENLEKLIGIESGREYRKDVLDSEITITDAQRQNVISWLIIKGVDKSTLTKSSLITLGKMYRIEKYLNSVLMSQERSQKRKPYRNLVVGFDNDIKHDIMGGVPTTPTPVIPTIIYDVPVKSIEITLAPTHPITQPVNSILFDEFRNKILSTVYNKLDQQRKDLSDDFKQSLDLSVQVAKETAEKITKDKISAEIMVQGAELKKFIEDTIFQSYLNHKIQNQTDTPHPSGGPLAAPPANSSSSTHSTHIPTLDPNYHFDPYATKVIRSALNMHENLYVYGDTGCGKTTHLEQVCAVLDRGLVRINPHDGITREMFLGGMKLINNETIFVEGALPLAMRNGLVFLVDEISFLPPNLTAILNPIGEKGGKLYIPETSEWITPAPGFCLFATDNTGGKGDRTGNYTGTEVQNTATLDRFAFCLKMDYLPQDKESEMLIKRFPNQDRGEINTMLTFARDIRLAFSRGELSLTLSTRKLIKFFDQRMNNFTTQEALSNTILSWLDEDDETLVKTMIDRLDLIIINPTSNMIHHKTNLDIFQDCIDNGMKMNAINIYRLVHVGFEPKDADNIVEAIMRGDMNIELEKTNPRWFETYNGVL